MVGDRGLCAEQPCTGVISSFVLAGKGRGTRASCANDALPTGPRSQAPKHNSLSQEEARVCFRESGTETGVHIPSVAHLEALV